MILLFSTLHIYYLLVFLCITLLLYLQVYILRKMEQTLLKSPLKSSKMAYQTKWERTLKEKLR